MVAKSLKTIKSGAGSFVQIPPTGNPLFDSLGVKTNAYPLWVKNLQNRGITLVEKSLKTGTHAEIGRKKNSTSLVIEIDPLQLTYINMLHESKHFEQIRIAENAGYNPFNQKHIALLEKGAYEYELKLADRYKFTEEYKNFARQRIRDYWISSIEKKYQFSPSFQNLAIILKI